MNAEKKEILVNAFLDRLTESERTILATIQEVEMWQGHSGGKLDPDSLGYIARAVKGGGGHFRGIVPNFLMRYLETNENATFAEVYENLLKGLGRIEWKSSRWEYIR